nr:response regulator transcription factor [Bacteroidota bacterium]
MTEIDHSYKMSIFRKNIASKMLRTLIIDDESHIRVTLSRFLAKYCPQVKLVGEATSVASGLEAIKEHNPGLILLDIKMADGTGFDLLHALDQIDFKVIFVTAHENYAIQAFKYSAVDFLLKPVNPHELAEAVRRAAEVRQSDYNTRLQALEDNFKSNEPHRKKIILKTQENIHLMDIQDIVFCESDGCYTRIYTKDKNKILISKLLKEYDELLQGAGFYRVHKSYLINLRHIKRFEKQDGGNIVLTNEHKLPVASRKKEELLELFEKLSE